MRQVPIREIPDSPVAPVLREVTETLRVEAGWRALLFMPTFDGKLHLDAVDRASGKILACVLLEAAHVQEMAAFLAAWRE